MSDGIELLQLDDRGRWSGTGPSGAQVGSLADVLNAIAEADADQEWLDCVAAVIAADSCTDGRSGLVVKRGSGTWFHVSVAENRPSILAHGLDWRRFPGSGIAGSRSPEAEGVFLCRDINSAGFFVQMAAQRGRQADIWAVTLDGQFLISAPDASGGLDDSWMISTEAIPARAVELRQAG
jgi:hypothetical protein